MQYTASRREVALLGVESTNTDIGAWGIEMAKKITRSRPWTKEEVRLLKTLAREQTKTTVIARKLKRSVAAVYLRASKLGVMLGGGRGRKRA
jgi:hypothetical protein